MIERQAPARQTRQEPGSGHEHYWAPSGIVQVPNADRGILGEAMAAAVMVCHCGAVQAVLVPAIGSVAYGAFDQRG